MFCLKCYNKSARDNSNYCQECWEKLHPFRDIHKRGTMPNWMKGGIFVLFCIAIVVPGLAIGILLVEFAAKSMDPLLVGFISCIVLLFGIGAAMGHFSGGVPSDRFDQAMNRIWKLRR